MFGVIQNPRYQTPRYHFEEVNTINYTSQPYYDNFNKPWPSSSDNLYYYRDNYYNEKCCEDDQQQYLESENLQNVTDNLPIVNYIESPDKQFSNSSLSEQNT